MTDYIVILERAGDGGWGAYTPDIDGVVAAGDTRDEAEANFREALQIHISELRRCGADVPPPRHAATTVRVA